MTSKIPVALRIDPELLKRLDAWLEEQPVSPSRTAVFETAVREFLDRHASKPEAGGDYGNSG